MNTTRKKAAAFDPPVERAACRNRTIHRRKEFHIFEYLTLFTNDKRIHSQIIQGHSRSKYSPSPFSLVNLTLYRWIKEIETV